MLLCHFEANTSEFEENREEMYGRFHENSHNAKDWIIFSITRSISYILYPLVLIKKQLKLVIYILKHI